MRRFFLNFTAVLFGLLSVTALVLWCVSYRRFDGFYFNVVPEQLSIYSQGGHISVDWSDVGGKIAPFIDWWDARGKVAHFRWHAQPAVYQGLNLRKFTWNSRTSNIQRLISITCPWWPVVLALAAWPAFRVWYLKRRRPPADPQARPCPACGYDLRGSPGDACPECGTKILRNQEEVRGGATFM